MSADDQEDLDREQTVLRDGAVEHQSTLKDLDAREVQDGVITCPNGDALCGGRDDLRRGNLPCFECFLDAPQHLIDQFNRQRVDARENQPTVTRGENDA